MSIIIVCGSPIRFLHPCQKLAELLAICDEFGSSAGGTISVTDQGPQFTSL
jgi:hypothetical protein